MSGRKLFTAIAMASILSLGFTGSLATAASISELNKQKENIEGKKSEIQSEINEASKKLDELEKKQAGLKSEMEEIDLEIQDAEAKINETNDKIKETNKEIKMLQGEIQTIEERIEKRNELLKDRARALQANGKINYLDVILGAQSFTDLISRISAVSTILEADKSIIEEQKEDLKLLEESKEKLEKDKKKIEALKTELELTKKALKKKKKEKDKIYKKLKEEQNQVEEYFMDLHEQQKVYAGQEAAIKKAIELEKQRQKEAAKQKQSTGKATTFSAGAPSKSSNSGGSGSSSSSSPRSGQSAAPAVKSSGGMFIRPTSGPVTSEFGPRWGSHHYGIDIGGAHGDPVYAAADGVVSNSYYSSSYGNVIFITHYINGRTYQTVYAHLASRAVSTGATVKKGQYIGAKGTTGQSTGVHLHFEIHQGKWNGEKSNAVNPRNYISF